MHITTEFIDIVVLQALNWIQAFVDLKSDQTHIDHLRSVEWLVYCSDSLDLQVR